MNEKEPGAGALFGVNVNPYATKEEEASEITKAADRLGMDIIWNPRP